jgi:hypothetical protein
MSCAIVEYPGYVDLPSFSPPSWLTDTYRIVVGAKIGNTWKHVRAGARYPVIPG